MAYFNTFSLDRENDMVIDLYLTGGSLSYVLRTPNHHTGNLIRNFARMCSLPLRQGTDGLLEAYGDIPSYIDGDNKEIYIMRLANTKVANIYPDGRIERRANVSAIAKTLMSQTKDYRLDVSKTIFKTFIRSEYKFRSDLHTHMNGNLNPDVLIALGIVHQIRYPLYYIRKLNLSLSEKQSAMLRQKRKRVQRQFASSELQGKYLERRIDDNTFINFADLILNNLADAEENITKIRHSLAIMKDGQAVFTNLEKVYLYRYVFCKGVESEEKIVLRSLNLIPCDEVRNCALRMMQDRWNPDYAENTLFQDKLLWIARGYQAQGITYAEISDTTLVKKVESVKMLHQVHEIMPKIMAETGVCLRFLAALRRIPLTLIKDAVPAENYLMSNLEVLKAVRRDPYVAGCDFVGEEINDIIDLKPVISEIVKIAADDPDFVIRIHAGENDSLKDNMSHSIECVLDSLAPGQKMPHMRIGHGLYTHKLSSAKGKKLLKEIRDNGIVLEFQITSNVRLNNWNDLSRHPLREYLKAGIHCVQGTDGGALYGTCSIDEQLTLEKLLDLTDEEMKSMKKTEEHVLRISMDAFENKKKQFSSWLNGRDPETALLTEMEQSTISSNLLLNSRKQSAAVELSSSIEELPWDRTPVVLAGGSFNTEKRTTHISEKGIEQMERMLDTLNPDEVFFVIGHKMNGYEKYLAEHNSKGFTIFAIVPSMLSREELRRIRNTDVRIRISTESQGMGIYKSFNYEIFERRPSAVVVFDGNSAAGNLIQEARNGKGKAAVLLWKDNSLLRAKVDSLEGYVHFFDEDHPLDEQIRALRRSM